MWTARLHWPVLPPPPASAWCQLCCPVTGPGACQLVPGWGLSLQLARLDAKSIWSRLAAAQHQCWACVMHLALQHCPNPVLFAGCGPWRPPTPCLPCPLCWSAPAGCAFVQYSKWAEAEKAIDAHNAKTVPPGGEVPLVVKFADARKKEPSQGRRGGQPDLWQDQRRQMAGAMPEQLLQVRSSQHRNMVCRGPPPAGLACLAWAG